MESEAKLKQLNSEKWNKWADSYDNKSWSTSRLRDAQHKLVSLLHIKENVSFLDVGCGTGFAVGEAAKSANFKGQFYGIDMSPKMIEKAKTNFSGKDFHFLEANSESIPLNDNFFDIIICTNSFHHYLHPDKAVKEMHRLLKKGGRVSILDITVPDGWLGRVLSKLHKMLEPEQVKLYSMKEFQQLFENAGLRYVTSQKIGMGMNVHIAEK